MPRRRAVSPLQAILMLLLVGLLAAWLMLGRTRKGNRTGEDGGALHPEFPADSVSEIDIERGGTMFRLLREADGFWLKDPYPDRADPELVAQSLRVAATLRPLRELPDTISGPFGLSHPYSIWICRWRGGEYRIAIGDSLPGGGGRYVKRTGSPNVLVVDGFLARRYLAPSIRSLHDPVAARIEVGPVDTVRVATREENLVIVRRRNDLWEIVSPIAAEASASELGRAVQALRSTELTDVLGPTAGLDLRSLGLDPPRAVWTLVQGGRRATVRIGHPTPDERHVRVIPAGRDVVCLISSESFRTWVDGLKRLREARVFRTPADSLERISVGRARGSRVFARAGDRGWVMLAGKDTLDLRQDLFVQAATNLSAAQAISFTTPWPRSAGPTLRFDLLFQGGERDSVEVAPERAGLSPIRAARLPGACAVAGTFYETWSRWIDHPPLRGEREAPAR